jgi:ubiquitin carboxyl-terminal hydrolase 36/42
MRTPLYGILCGTSSTLRCGGCKKVAYCSKECQTRHWWNGHNRQCKLLQAQEALANSTVQTTIMSETKTAVPLPSKIISSERPTNLPFTRSPSRILFSRKRVQQMLEFEDKLLGIGCGLRNVGNSCYLNAVLQCLTHTQPLTNFFICCDHSATCVCRF